MTIPRAGTTRPDQESGTIVADAGANRAGRERRHRRAELMARADPSVDHSGIFLTECLRRQLDGRGHGRHPIESVENGEGAETHSTFKQRRWQEQQREPTQRVIREQQIPSGAAIGQPA
jgi:hypothetical protein